MPRTREFDPWVRQLIRCSSSVGSNYRAACRAKSRADFINKLKIVEEEADESVYWLELIQEAMGTNSPELNSLLKEANELLSIVVSSIKTAKHKRSKNN